jgi:hypothetical protein
MINYIDVNKESLSLLMGPLIIDDGKSHKNSSLYFKSNPNHIQKFLLNKKSKKILKENQIRCDFVKEMLKISNAFYNEILCNEDFPV